jgi:hypothetical protein
VTLAELAIWQRRQARAAAGADRELHLAAVQLLTQVIARRTRDSEAIKAGLAVARAAGKKPGRARVDSDLEQRVRQPLASGATVRQVMAETGCGASAVYWIKAEMDEVGGQ